MITHVQQRANLARLAAHLRTVHRAAFDMTNFLTLIDPRTESNYDFDLSPANAPHLCGTVACAIGHGPGAGIPGLLGERWQEYSRGVFGVPQILETTDPGINPINPVWDWLFDSTWTAVDNSPGGAAARIEHYLNHGVPDDYIEQIRGDKPLCYDPDSTPTDSQP